MDSKEEEEDNGGADIVANECWRKTVGEADQYQSQIVTLSMIHQQPLLTSEILRIAL